MFELFDSFNIKLNYATGIVVFSTWLYLCWALGKSINKDKPENNVMLFLLSLIIALLSGLVVIGYYIASKLDALYL